MLVSVLKRTETLDCFKTWRTFSWLVPNLHQTYFPIIRAGTKPHRNVCCTFLHLFYKQNSFCMFFDFINSFLCVLQAENITKKLCL